MSRLPLAFGCVLLAACESVIGLGDLEFDRGGGGMTAGSSATTSSSASGDTTSSTSATTTSGYGGYGGGGGYAPTYVDLVREDEPISYWRLGESGNELEAKDDLDQHPGVYFTEGSGEYRLEQPGAIFGDPDTATAFVDGGRMIVNDAAPFRFPGAAPFSLELWMKFDSGGDTGHTPIYCHDPSASAGWILYVDAAAFFLKRYGTDDEGSPGSQGSPSGTVLNDGVEFHHIVVTMDEARVGNLYVDGTLAQIDFQWDIDIAAHDAPLVLGKTGFDSVSPLIALDEVALYDQPLSPARVSLHYRCGRFGECD